MISLCLSGQFNGQRQHDLMSRSCCAVGYLHVGNTLSLRRDAEGTVAVPKYFLASQQRNGGGQSRNESDFDNFTLGESGCHVPARGNGGGGKHVCIPGGARLHFTFKERQQRVKDVTLRTEHCRQLTLTKKKNKNSENWVREAMLKYVGRLSRKSVRVDSSFEILGILETKLQP